VKNIKKIISFGILMQFLLLTITPIYGSDSNSYSNIIEIEFNFLEPQIKDIEIGNEIYDRITIEGLSNTNNYNEPRLPIKPIKILIPHGKSVDSIDVILSGKTRLDNNFKVELGQELIPNNKNSLFKETSTTEYIRIPPVKQFEEIGTYFSRGFQVLFVNLYPVEYDTETGEINYYKNMKLSVELKDSISVYSFRGSPNDYELITDLVDNPSDVKSYPKPDVSALDDTYEYIIITGEDFETTSGDYTFQDLIQSKINRGLTAGIFTVEDIVTNSDYNVNGPWGDNNPSNPFYQYPIIGDIEQFDDDQARIRNFIRYAYTDLGTKYVLLAGDADFGDSSQNVVPVRCIYANETGLPLKGSDWFEEDDIPSDVYYACLDGNFNYDGDNRWGEDEIGNNLTEIDEADLLSEVWVGRACIDSDDEVSNFVMKTIGFESSNDSYLKNILFVGEHLGFPGVSEWGGNYKDVMLPLVPDDFNVDTLYDRDLPQYWTDDDIMEILNNGTYFLINHDGHSYYGYNMRMSNGDVDSLINDNFFFVYSHGCMAGGFDNPDGYDCIAEHYTVKTEHGAYGGIWNARYGLGSNNTLDSPSGAFDISFFKALFEEGFGEMGRASHFSKEDNIPRINENGFRWCYYQTNLFGDPELSFFNHTSSSNPPEKPQKPQGPAVGGPGKNLTYCTNTTDPDDDDVYYWFDWGDGTNSGWIGPFASGEEVCFWHIWKIKGTYQVKVKAKDIYSTVSEWSDPLSVIIPKSKTTNNYPFLNILERFPILYQLIRYLIDL
jgi:hypothetical protein